MKHDEQIREKLVVSNRLENNYVCTLFDML